MARIRTAEQVKAVAALWISDAAVPRYAELEARLEELLSPIDSRGAWFSPPETDYYRREMGEGLRKRLVAFRDLITIDRLPELKIKTNQLEALWMADGRRVVNIDPGYICAPKFVLASAKDYSHRLYIGQGIFGDIQLRFSRGHFKIQPWTYPDYRSPERIAFLESVRESFMQQGASPRYSLS